MNGNVNLVEEQRMHRADAVRNTNSKNIFREHPGCTRTKGFRYPPILPVVYYEGKPKWTADMHLCDRVMLSGIFQKSIPDFTYEVVRLHDYGNEELLERGDEMSLIMMFNKIQDAMDLEEFLQIPSEKLNAIIKDTPEYIVDVIACVMKALCVKIDAGEEETDRCIQKVKERKMGYLFENMEKMSIREERRLRAEAEQRADEAEKHLEEAEKHLEEAEKHLEEVEKRAEQLAEQLAQQRVNEAVKEAVKKAVDEAEKRAEEAEQHAKEVQEELAREREQIRKERERNHINKLS